MQTDNEIWTLAARDAALESLKKWHGTPHKNRIAIVGVGIDCIKLLSEVLIDSGIVERVEYGSYSVNDGQFEKSTRLQSVIEYAFHVEIVPVDQMRFGDIAVFKNGTRSAHVGFYDGRDIWHALANRIVTHNDFKLWRRSIEVAYRITQCGWKESPQKTIKLFMS